MPQQLQNKKENEFSKKEPEVEISRRQRIEKRIAEVTLAIRRNSREDVKQSITDLYLSKDLKYSLTWPDLKRILTAMEESGNIYIGTLVGALKIYDEKNPIVKYLEEIVGPNGEKFDEYLREKGDPKKAMAKVFLKMELILLAEREKKSKPEDKAIDITDTEK